MKFGEFATYLQELESTSSRNEMTVILAKMFKQASAEDGRLIAYLSQGKIGPGYASLDMGVADKMMLRALGDQAGNLFKDKGDLGLVAQELASKKKSDLSVEEVFNYLVEIAETNGTGSQEKKQTLIKDLLKKLDAISAKYMVRIILSKLRTGFSDMTVLDSLSWMLIENKPLRPIIEKAYNVRADLGEVVEMVKKSGDVKHLHMEPRIGTPILMAKAERATSASQVWERNGECALEYKLDGLRIQAHLKNGSVTLFSRGLENVTHMYPDIVDSLNKQIKKNCVVEGEMIAMGENGKFLPFQETVQRKRKYNIAEMAGKIPLVIYVFDILVFDGKSVMSQPNHERRKLLETIVQTGDGVVLMPRVVVKTVEDIDRYFDQAIKAGTEGIIAKKLVGPYQAGGRDFNWIKYKKSYDVKALADTIDVVVMGYDYGQGKRNQFGIGDFLVGVYDSDNDSYLTVAKIGTGLTDDEWHKMKKLGDNLATSSQPTNYQVNKIMTVDVWCKPKIVVEIQADEITKSPMHAAGLALRFPRLVSWRGDKSPTDATTIAELKNMVKLN